LWSEFSEVQKTFFDRLKSGFQRLTSEQEAMQKEKIAQIETLKAFTFSTDIETLKEEYNNFWDTWKAISRLDTVNQEKINYSFSNALLAGVKKVELDNEVKNEILMDLNALILQGDSKRLQQELQTARTNVSSLKAELTQLENNLAFFSNSSSENPLFKNVEKQIKTCQNKIDKATEDYIRLKQIRNSQEKSAKKVSENSEQETEESTEDN
jgi:gas vesicle protein